MKKYTKLLLVSYISAVQFVSFTDALAVGNGLDFEIENMLEANSMDFTAHACTRTGGINNDRLKELGYFWISSYQDADSVVDSNINNIPANGYHIYGKYNYQATQFGLAQPTISGNRLNYRVSPLNASIELFYDPSKDTKLDILNCQITINDNADDIKLGESLSITQGEKSETNGLANGDYKVVFNNWMWSIDALQLFDAVTPNSLEYFNSLVFNGNITTFGGILGNSHTPEGSGNLFWLENFVPVYPED